ncbi:hypothetical protein BD779DRAFT_1396577, partial [Infundibulicybe gibba]
NTNLELGDQLSIDEVTLEAFSILGQKGQIRPAHGHECAECTQPYKAQSEFIAQQDPAATDNMDVDADMDVDYAAVKMVVMDGIVMGPTHCAYDDCTQDLDNSRGGAFCAYHNIYYGACCCVYGCQGQRINPTEACKKHQKEWFKYKQEHSRPTLMGVRRMLQ